VWPYKDKKSYVISHQKIDNDQNIKQTDKNLRELIIDLKQEEGKNIWICGGASIVQQLINSDLIDQYHITIIPTILSKGIALFEHLNKKIDLKLIQTNNYNGMVDLIYKHK
jgi:dihydrofolate reductase